jgi:hypothetical protein
MQQRKQVCQCRALLQAQWGALQNVSMTHQDQEQRSGRICFGEVGMRTPVQSPASLCSKHLARDTSPPGLSRNLVALGLVHPPPTSSSAYQLWLPNSTGGDLTQAGVSLLSFLSPVHSKPLCPPPSISSSIFSLRSNARGTGSRVFMVFDSDMLLTPPPAYSAVSFC